MAIVTIIGAGMMGSALAFPARENGNEVRLVGTPLDRESIETSAKTGRHPKFTKDFPAGLKYYQIEDMEKAIYEKIVALNKTLPTYKHIKSVELRDTEFEKTTSRKIRRHLVK